MTQDKAGQSGCRRDREIWLEATEVLRAEHQDTSKEETAFSDVSCTGMNLINGNTFLFYGGYQWLAAVVRCHCSPLGGLSCRSFAPLGTVKLVMENAGEGHGNAKLNIVGNWT